MAGTNIYMIASYSHASKSSGGDVIISAACSATSKVERLDQLLGSRRQGDTDL